MRDKDVDGDARARCCRDVRASWRRRRRRRGRLPARDLARRAARRSRRGCRRRAASSHAKTTRCRRIAGARGNDVCVAGSIFLAGAVRDAPDQRVLSCVDSPRLRGSDREFLRFLLPFCVCLLARGAGCWRSLRRPRQPRPRAGRRRPRPPARRGLLDQVIGTGSSRSRPTTGASPGRRVAIPGATFKFFADQVDLLPGHEPARRARATSSSRRRRPHRRRTGGLQRRTPAPERSTRRPASCRSARPSTCRDVRQPGSRRLLLRRDDREARAAAVPAHARRRSPRACSRRRGGKSPARRVTHQPRRLRRSRATRVLRVKGVPVMYLPVIYYPIQDDDRATGFLLPTYGTSTLRGQAISNAFFWAIDRSQDATFVHDWFTQTGQGMGGEYRYVASDQSQGNLRLYRFSQNETEFTEDGGRPPVCPRATASRYRHGEPEPRHAAAGPRLRRLFFRHRHAAALPPEHLPGDAEPTDDRGRPQRLVRRDLDERPLPAQRVPDRRTTRPPSTAARRASRPTWRRRCCSARRSMRRWTPSSRASPYRQIRDGVVTSDRTLNHAGRSRRRCACRCRA